MHMDFKSMMLLEGHLLVEGLKDPAHADGKARPEFLMLQGL